MTATPVGKQQSQSLNNISGVSVVVLGYLHYHYSGSLISYKMSYH